MVSRLVKAVQKHQEQDLTLILPTTHRVKLVGFSFVKWMFGRANKRFQRTAPLRFAAQVKRGSLCGEAFRDEIEKHGGHCMSTDPDEELRLVLQCL
jgi:hypothetical protein